MGNKRVKTIVALVITAIVIFTVMVYALVKESFEVRQEVKTGTVEIQTDLKIEDKIAGTMGTNINNWQPGDANLIQWETKNIGTAAAYTRYTLQIYWNQEIPEKQNSLIYLYPANITNSEILQQDFSEVKTTDTEHLENSKYIIKGKEIQTLNIGNEEKTGIEYIFTGDVLDGTSTSGYASEVNYNSQDFAQLTDDNDTNKDIVAFRILLNPNISYLYQEKTLSIRLITEAMQYTEEGQAEWQIVNEQEIN